MEVKDFNLTKIVLETIRNVQTTILNLRSKATHLLPPVQHRLSVRSPHLAVNTNTLAKLFVFGSLWKF